ncbi:ABC transporter permease [Promicromonospora sp. NPDC057138]|uniref:ABC transporter permease n=1 Tax=Promicromonospora sp. NPDC057138 TaxID=3346031 RepID=UPI00363FC857
MPGNPWFSWSYVVDNAPVLWERTVEHAGVTIEAVAISAAIAIPLGALVSRYRWLSGPVLGTAAVLYTVPSLALFAILTPALGIGRVPVLVGLVVYALLIILRNTVAGLATVDPAVLDAGRGLGYGSGRLLVQVAMPSALPSIIAGLRLATVSSVALVTVGVVVGYGGLGQIMFQGFRNNSYRAEIMAATLATILLALVLDLALWAAGRALTPWLRRRTA